MSDPGEQKHPTQTSLTADLISLCERALLTEQEAELLHLFRQSKEISQRSVLRHAEVCQEADRAVDILRGNKLIDQDGRPTDLGMKLFKPLREERHDAGRG